MRVDATRPVPSGLARRGLLAGAAVLADLSLLRAPARVVRAGIPL
ncbi:hypothetical protein AB0E83_15620 [Streptomyces sp. NPDC035033]